MIRVGAKVIVLCGRYAGLSGRVVERVCSDRFYYVEFKPNLYPGAPIPKFVHGMYSKKELKRLER